MKIGKNWKYYNFSNRNFNIFIQRYDNESINKKKSGKKYFP